MQRVRQEMAKTDKGKVQQARKKKRKMNHQKQTMFSVATILIKVVVHLLTT